ncbi:MAG: NAD(P)H-binding protein [Moraxella sp.]|nr:NAD(P)H-binding protein [Moraxella sp.]
MKAIVLGATGATGRVLTKQLLDNDDYQSVTVFTRKPLAFTHPKLAVHLIDFEAPDTWTDKVQGGVLFCCLGTTLKQAGSQENQIKIDHDYPLMFAEIAKQNGIERFAVISSDGADADSRLFYYRLKGRLENDLQNVGLSHLIIFRPPLLKRENSNRLGEVAGGTVLSFLNRFGLFKSVKPMPTDVLAKAMIRAVAENKTGVLDKSEIWALAYSDKS